MIRTIFLHIGVHKTATTTIQNTLSTERFKLSEAGVLFPVFKACNIPISNHSIPFYSLFCGEPEKYHFNVSHGFTTGSAIRQLHEEYRQQLEAQLANFHGETLIISGEDISLLVKHDLENLQAWLTKITQPEVNIRAVMMCRHPVSRFRSALQGSVCDFGLPLEKAIPYHLRHTHFYRKIIQVFSEVFGRCRISVLKYEDAASHPYGPAGALLALVEDDIADKIKPGLLHENKTRNYETFMLLNAINQTCNRTSGYELQPQRMVELNKLFGKFPGQKFILPHDLSKRVWDTLSDDIQWLCHEFLLEKYDFQCEDLEKKSNIWSTETLAFLKNILPQLSETYKKAVLIGLLEGIKINNNKLTKVRQLEIFEFVLFHSYYLGLGSRVEKLKFFAFKIGFAKSLGLSLLTYFRRKKK